MNNVASNKLYWVYFWCSIAVCVMHGAGLTNVVGGGDFLCRFLYYVGIPAMGWFFFSSAYFLFRNYEEKSWSVIIAKKAKSLMIPYLIWNIIGYIWFSLVYHKLVLHDNTRFTIKGLFMAFIFLFIPPDKIVSPANGGMWFIARLFSYILITPIIARICKKKLGWIAIFIIEGIVLGFHVSYYSFIYWLPIYSMGAWCAINIRDKYESLLARNSYDSIMKNRKMFCCGSILIYIIYVLILCNGLVSADIGRFFAPLVIYVCAIFWPIKSTANWWIKHSNFYMYCSHGLFMNIMIPIVLRLNFQSEKPLVFKYLACVGATLACVYVSLYLLKKIMPDKWMSLLMGGRA